jgi:hypothetical protein
MATVGVALVNGVWKSGYLFAPGFVGDGSQLTDVHTSNITSARTGELAYYVDSTTIGGNPSEVTINGNLYVSGTLYSSNTVIYENHILSVGSFESEAHTKGVLISNVMMGLTENVLTFGYTSGKATDIQLFPDLDRNIEVDILGSLKSKTFFGDASNLSNIIDAPQGTYGDGFTVPQVVVGPTGRSTLNLMTIQSSLESVTDFGTGTSKSIQFENRDVSLSTFGKVGIANANPSSLLCVGSGVQISDKDVCVEGTVTSSYVTCDGSNITKTSDAAPGSYGDGLTVPVVTVNKKGRLCSLETLKITSNLETVTSYGSSSNKTIQLTNEEISLVTQGSVGISTTPRSLLSIGTSTDFDGDNLTMSGNVMAQNFTGNAAQLTNTSDVKPGIYGGGAIIPQIWIDKQGRLSDIQLTNIFMTLDQVTAFNSSTSATLFLRNKGTGLVSEGDIHVTCGRDIVLLDEFHNSVCTFGQKSESDSRITHLAGTQEESVLNISNWQKVSVNEGLSIDSKGFTTMKGCFMESGTGYIINAQQLSKSNEEVLLTPIDLFKWFSFLPATEKIVRLPDPTSCKAGSWIGLTNLSQSSCIQIFDVFGTTLYARLESSEFAAGVSKRFMCVSTLASANGSFMGGMWVLA